MNNSGARRALDIYLSKGLKEKKQRKKNEKPEKLVEAEVLFWLRNNGFFVSIVDSSAVYNPHAGRYLSTKARVGFPDCVGLHESGIFCGIELKAKGRRSTLRDGQRDFLENVIEKNGFACVVDSVERLKTIWDEFLKSDNKKKTLTAFLPERREREDEPLFDLVD